MHFYMYPLHKVTSKVFASIKIKFFNIPRTEFGNYYENMINNIIMLKISLYKRLNVF